jgi:mRNA interferase RelE/StbE
MSGPPWRIAVAASARRQISEHLPEAVAAACIEFLAGPLTDNPHRVGAPSRKPFEGQWRARRGTYRIRYRINEPDHTVYVLDVDHRRDAYRR